MSTEPKLRVEWEPPGRAFLAALGVVLSTPRVQPNSQNVKTGARWQAPFASILFHIGVLVAWITVTPFIAADLPGFQQRLEPQLLIDRSHVRIVYVRGNLPTVSGVTGAASGRQGRSGGEEFPHPTQVIRIAVGRTLVPRIVEPGQLPLPRTELPANLLTLSSAPPAPPVSLASRVVLPFAARVVPPAPEIHSGNLAKVPPLPDTVIPPPAVVPLVTRAPRLTLPAVRPNPPENGSAPQKRIEVNTVDAPEPSVASAANKGAAGQPAARAAGTPNNVLTGGGEGPGILIISVKAGDQAGVTDASAGSLSMSPAGVEGSGFSGKGGGTGIGNGTGRGSGRTGEGSGADGSGNGLGSEAKASDGISPLPGPGGAGGGSNATVIPQIVISGGAVHLPSFGAGAVSTLPTRGPRRNAPPDVVVIASPRSGGGVDTYGTMRGSRVYTIYIQTHVGTAVLEYADPSARPGFEQDLLPPEPLHTEVPADLHPVQTIVACVLDRFGELRNLRIVRTESPQLSSRLLEVLRTWSLRPVFRGNEAIAVDAVLGFGVDTR